MSQKKIRHATFNMRNIAKINENFEELFSRERGSGDVGEITTDQILTNSYVVFRDAKGRFKATDEFRDLKNQLEVNRWIVEQLEGFEGGDLPPMDVEPTANTLVKRDSAGNVKASTLVATQGNFGGAQGLRSFNLYGDGFDGRLSLQSNQGGGPGLEMTTDGNRTRALIKLIRAGVNGTELQVWTSKDDGVIHMPFVFGKGGEFLLREPGSTTNANYNTAGGFKNAGGKIQYRNDGGAWTELGAGSSTLSVSPEQLIETLSTLRDATQDETTVEGLRDAIGNAIGGLIEKFEAQLASEE